MKKKYKVLIIISAIVVVLVVAGVIGVSIIQKNLEILKVMEIKNVDLSQVADGVYSGSYSAFPTSAEVSVTVKDHAIMDIELVKHTHGKGGAAEVLPQMVVDAQSLQVDVISGATSSSKVILLAIEDALSQD
jgi:uncharacterized protein with FMN-binding domain